MNELYFRVKKLYQKEKGAYPDPILNLTWKYGEKDPQGKVKHLDVHKVAMEINGYYHDDVYDTKATPPKLIGRKGDLVPNFVSLRTTGRPLPGTGSTAGAIPRRMERRPT